MYYLTKSALRVAGQALAAGEAALRRYSHKFSPKVYTQPQLFACLAVKVFLKTDCRGLTVLLDEWPDLAGAIGLARIPHWTTLQRINGDSVNCGASEAPEPVHQLVCMGSASGGLPWWCSTSASPSQPGR